MSYPTDLTQEQFNLIVELLPKKKLTKPRIHSLYDLFNAILYVLVSGCQWRLLPNDLPPWKTVHHYFLTWSEDEVFDEILKKSLVKKWGLGLPRQSLDTTRLEITTRQK